MNGARRGFTIIELLTVMAILATLSAILLPAAAVAADAARRAGCQAHLHEIGIAFTHYATRHRGLLPPFGSSQHSRGRNYYLSDPSVDEDWTAMLATGVIESEANLFCPGTSTPSHQFDTPQNPWPPGLVRTGYSRRFIEPNSPTGLYFSHVPSGRAVAADLVVSPVHIAYQHGIGINVLYTDGDVQWRTDILKLFEDAGVTGPQASNDQLDAVWEGLDRRPGRH